MQVASHPFAAAPFLPASPGTAGSALSSDNSVFARMLSERQSNSVPTPTAGSVVHGGTRSAPAPANAPAPSPVATAPAPETHATPPQESTRTPTAPNSVTVAREAARKLEANPRESRFATPDDRDGAEANGNGGDTDGTVAGRSRDARSPADASAPGGLPTWLAPPPPPAGAPDGASAAARANAGANALDNDPAGSPGRPGAQPDRGVAGAATAIATDTAGGAGKPAGAPTAAGARAFEASAGGATAHAHDAASGAFALPQAAATLAAESASTPAAMGRGDDAPAASVAVPDAGPALLQHLAAMPHAAMAPPSPVDVTLQTPVGASAFKADLGVQVSLLARDGVQQAELHLNPADMGPISVQIELAGKQAQVDFGADSAATRQILESGMPELASALRDAGFTLSGGGVSQHSRGGRSPDGGSGSGRGGGPRIDAASDRATPRRVGLTLPLGAVDLYA